MPTYIDRHGLRRAQPNRGPPYFSDRFDRIKKLLGIHEVSYKDSRSGEGEFNYSALKNSTFRVLNCSLKTEVSCLIEGPAD